MTVEYTGNAFCACTQVIFDVLLKFRSRRHTFLAYLACVVHSQRMSFLVILQRVHGRENLVALQTCVRVRFVERYVLFQRFGRHKTVHTFTALIGCLAGDSMILQCLTADKYLSKCSLVLCTPTTTTALTFEHISHLNMIRSLCMMECSFSFRSEMNSLPQSVHVCLGMLSSCNDRCSLYMSNVKCTLLHLEQGYSLRQEMMVNKNVGQMGAVNGKS